MKEKIASVLRKQMGDLSEEELQALAKEVAALVEEEQPKPEEKAGEDAAPEGEAEAGGEEPQPEESAEEQPKPLTAENVRAIVLSILEEIGLLESTGGAMQMSAKPRDLKKALDSQQKAIADLKAQLVNDVARLAVEVEALSKRGGSGPVLRELGALDAKTSAALQQAEALKKALENVTDPMAAQALRNEIAKLEIQAVHQTQK